MEIRRHFQDLIDLGFGVIRGVGKAMEWCFGEGQKLDGRGQKGIPTNDNQNYSYAYIPPIQGKSEKVIVTRENSELKTREASNSELNNPLPLVHCPLPFVDNVDNVDNNQVKSEKLKIESNNFDSIICSNSDSKPYDSSDILEDSLMDSASTNHLPSASCPLPSKYHRLYAIVPKHYSQTGILVDLREENGYLWGRQSGMSKFIKVPLSQVIEYRQE